MRCATAKMARQRQFPDTTNGMSERTGSETQGVMSI